MKKQNEKTMKRKKKYNEIQLKRNTMKKKTEPNSTSNHRVYLYIR